MKEFWVDFSGYIKVKADSDKEAREKFWHFVQEGIDLHDSGLSGEMWNIEGVEEITES